MVMTHRINLVNDWEKIILNRMDEQGHRMPSYTDKLDLGIRYCNLEYMHIITSRRKVYVSKEFRYPSKYKKRILHLKKKIEKGEDINPFLSKGSTKIKNKDYLLYDWNIYHLHLGKHKHGERFSARTEDLLFIYVTEKSIYFLNVLNHNSFADKGLLSILHKNWPSLLKPYLIPPSIRINPVLPNESIHLFRKNGISSFTQLDSGEIFMPPGRGVVSTSDSARAVDSTQRLLNVLYRAEKEIITNPNKFISEILEETGRITEKLNIELKIIKGKFFIKELNSDYMKYIFDHADYLNINNS